MTTAGQCGPVGNAVHGVTGAVGGLVGDAGGGGGGLGGAGAGLGLGGPSLGTDVGGMTYSNSQGFAGSFAQNFNGGNNII